MNHNSGEYFEKRVRRKAGSAIRDFGMIGPGDRILVAVSGGRDSIVLLKILHGLRKSAPIDFEIVPVHLSTGFEKGFGPIGDWVRENLRLEVKVHDTGIAEILKNVSDPEKSPCALCSRLRRGVLYSLAREEGYTSIALGHHLDDIVETFFLRCMYTGQIGAMAPSRCSNDGQNRVIRPLAYCRGDLIEAYFATLGIEPVGNACMIRKDGKREQVRNYLKHLEKDIPRLKENVFSALGNIDIKSLCLMKEASHAHHH